MAPPFSSCNPFLPWYNRLAAFKIEDLFSRKTRSRAQRTVFVNENLPEDYFDRRGRVKKEKVHTTNQIITSKYTMITFIPRNFLEQFRRTANWISLGFVLLESFNKHVTGFVLPTVLTCIGWLIIAAKDALEDIQRQMSDHRTNRAPVQVLGGGDWVNPNTTAQKSNTFVRWTILNYDRCERIVNKLAGEELDGLAGPQEDIPDIEYDDDKQQHPSQEIQEGEQPERNHAHRLRLLGHHEPSRPHWKKTPWEDVRVGDFVKIKDGGAVPADMLICSTSEDRSIAYIETQNIDGESNLKSRNAVAALAHIRNAADCASLHNAFRVECGRPDANMNELNATLRVGNDVFPVDIQAVLLRGTVLRNTRSVVGVVLYAGEDTRIAMNAGDTPSKRSEVERQMDTNVLLNLVLLTIMAAICGIGTSVLQHQDYPPGALWLYGADRPDDNPSINGLFTFMTALLTFQKLVPFLLYVLSEISRVIQVASLRSDEGMSSGKEEKRTLARSWKLLDDLGQIEYIFSDKTGTLTQNSMVLRKCSISGKAYHGDGQEETVLETNGLPQTELANNNPVGSLVEDIPLSDIRSPRSSTADGRSSPEHSNPGAARATGTGGPSLADSLTSHSVETGQRFFDAELSNDLRQAIHAEPDSAYEAHAQNLNRFFTVLALCHTVLASVDPETAAIEYSAQSPDEVALVRAAANMGFIFHGRDRQLLLLQTPLSVDEHGEGIFQGYQLLNTLEFTTARKMMSVILRRLDSDDRRIFLLTKGADSVIFGRLNRGDGEEAEALSKATAKHLDDFARQGLRTLTLAYKVIGDEEYEAWSQKYHRASTALHDRDEKLEAISSEIERDLQLLGATAIEDKLQDDVPETIADLKEAGIRIWVTTGDKLETAIATGHSTKLISEDSNLIVIRGTGDLARPVWNQLVDAARDFSPRNGIVDEHGILMDASELMAPPPRAARGESAGASVGGGEGPGAGRIQEPGSQWSEGSGRAETSFSSVVGAGNGERPGGLVLVIDGTALGIALNDEQHKILLLRLARFCESVICCRTSPLQKALVVKLVKEGLGAMTLAIGDGANDVSMIQAADVGVGIIGEEGLQAVNSSDFAIGQFRLLKRLLLVHGHWSYAKNSGIALHGFYKNALCVGILWWFQFHCGWSSSFALDYIYVLLWNVLWTIVPVTIIGPFVHVDDAAVLMEIPGLYVYGRKRAWFNMKRFFTYTFDGIVQSAIIYFLILCTYSTTTTRPDGWQISQPEFSTTMAFGAAFTANFYFALNANAWNVRLFFVMGGIVVMWAFTATLYNVAPLAELFAYSVWGPNDFLFRSPYYWLSLPLVTCLALTPRYLMKAYQFNRIPRYVYRKNPRCDLSQEVVMPDPFSGSVSWHVPPLPHRGTESVTSSLAA